MTNTKIIRKIIYPCDCEGLGIFVIALTTPGRDATDGQIWAAVNAIAAGAEGYDGDNLDNAREIVNQGGEAFAKYGREWRRVLNWRHNQWDHRSSLVPAEHGSRGAFLALVQPW